MRTAEETTLLLALFITKYKIDSDLYVFLRCLINLNWHDSCRNKILKPLGNYWEVLFFPRLSFHAKQGVLSHNSNLQSIDFLQTESKERKVCYFKRLFYKAIKARTTLESPNRKGLYNWRS